MDSPRINSEPRQPLNRDRVLETLHLLASPDAQVQDLRKVPIADEPADLLMLWSESFCPNDAGLQALFTDEQWLGLLRFHSIFTESVAELPQTLPPIDELVLLPLWQSVIQAAADTLELFSAAASTDRKRLKLAVCGGAAIGGGLIPLAYHMQGGAAVELLPVGLISGGLIGACLSLGLIRPQYVYAMLGAFVALAIVPRHFFFGGRSTLSPLRLGFTPILGAVIGWYAPSFRPTAVFSKLRHIADRIWQRCTLERVFGGALCGIILGGILGFINVVLHAPWGILSNPLSGEWYFIAVFYCVSFGTLVGALMGILVAVITAKHNLLVCVLGILLASLVGCVVGLVFGPELYAEEHNAFQGTRYTFTGILIGIPLICWLTRKRNRHHTDDDPSESSDT